MQIGHDDRDQHREKRADQRDKPLLQSAELCIDAEIALGTDRLVRFDPALQPAYVILHAGLLNSAFAGRNMRMITEWPPQIKFDAFQSQQLRRS